MGTVVMPGDGYDDVVVGAAFSVPCVKRPDLLSGLSFFPLATPVRLGRLQILLNSRHSSPSLNMVRQIVKVCYLTLADVDVSVG